MFLEKLLSLKSKENDLPTFPLESPLYYKHDNYIPATDYIHHEF